MVEDDSKKNNAYHQLDQWKKTEGYRQLKEEFEEYYREVMRELKTVEQLLRFNCSPGQRLGLILTGNRSHPIDFGLITTLGPLKKVQ
jgi:hypothetical protein